MGWGKVGVRGALEGAGQGGGRVGRRAARSRDGGVNPSVGNVALATNKNGRTIT